MFHSHVHLAGWDCLLRLDVSSIASSFAWSRLLELLPGKLSHLLAQLLQPTALHAGHRQHRQVRAAPAGRRYKKLGAYLRIAD